MGDKFWAFLGSLGVIAGLALLISNIIEGSTEDVGLAVFVIIPGLLLVLGFFAKKNIEKEKKRLYKNIDSVGKINLGKYIYGLKYQPDSTTENIECFITDNALIFLNTLGKEIDRIKTNAINDIFIDDKSQITQRLTVTRILTLGIFSMAAPKKNKHKEFCLVIDWDSEDGSRNNTIFEFSGTKSNAMANQAINTLKKHIKLKVERIKDDEKKCPYCAEIIKKEAKICRYCHQQL